MMTENNQQPYLYTMPPYSVATKPITDSSVCSLMPIDDQTITMKNNLKLSSTPCHS